MNVNRPFGMKLAYSNLLQIIDKSAVIRKHVVSMRKSIDDINGNFFQHRKWKLTISCSVCVCAPW